jgi:membrane carboxypeptidase/penicillin-binding protein
MTFKNTGDFISIRGTIRALSRTLLKRRIAEGGSAITQQLTKTTFLTHEKTTLRKIKELCFLYNLKILLKS